MKDTAIDRHADKAMLVVVFLGLLIALWLFHSDQNTSAVIGTQIGVVVGAVCGIAQGKPRQALQQNIDSTVKQEVSQQ